MAAKKRCVAVCIACACWNPAWEIPVTQELKRCPNTTGRIWIWNHSAAARGGFLAFPKWKGREGKVGGSAAPTWCRQGRNPSPGSAPGLLRRDGTPVKAGAVTTLRHTLFPFRTGRNHCGQGLPSRVSLRRGLERADRPALGRWASGLAPVSSG